MGSPEVSIVLACFNAERHVIPTVESVRAQTLRDWDLIVVDDGSTDETVAMLEKWARGENRVRLQRLGRNTGGPATPRNVGVALARGRCVAFLDADDIWHPRKLERQLTEMERTRAQVVSTRRRSFRRDEEVCFHDPHLKVDAAGGERLSYSRLALKNWLCTSSVLGETGLFRRHPFPEDLRYKAVEDYWCWLKVHEEVGWSWLMWAPLVFYRRGDASISRSRWYMIRRHWVLYGDYFGGGAAGGLRRWRSMSTYACFSLWRAFREKTFKIR